MVTPLVVPETPAQLRSTLTEHSILLLGGLGQRRRGPRDRHAGALGGDDREHQPIAPATEQVLDLMAPARARSNGPNRSR